MTITEFLTARLDEDEAIWKQAAEHGLLLSLPGESPVLAAQGTVERFLADVAAKRAIVENLWAVRLEQPAIRMYREGLAEVTLRMLALPYAEHPDWREEWRP